METYQKVREINKLGEKQNKALFAVAVQYWTFTSVTCVDVYDGLVLFRLRFEPCIQVYSLQKTCAKCRTLCTVVYESELIQSFSFHLFLDFSLGQLFHFFQSFILICSFQLDETQFPTHAFFFAGNRPQNIQKGQMTHFENTRLISFCSFLSIFLHSFIFIWWFHLLLMVFFNGR